MKLKTPREIIIFTLNTSIFGPLTTPKPIVVVVVWFGGYIQLCSKFIPGSVPVRNHIWKAQKNMHGVRIELTLSVCKASGLFKLQSKYLFKAQFL